MINKLIEMGFNKKESIEALEKSNFKMRIAIDYLLDSNIKNQIDLQRPFENKKKSNFISQRSNSSKEINNNINFLPSLNNNNEIIKNGITEKDITIVRDILKPEIDLSTALDIYLECNKNIEKTKICLKFL